MQLSKETEERVAFAKLFVEQKYSRKKVDQEKSQANWQFFERHMAELGLSQPLREELREELRHKQAVFQRQQRTKVGASDFESIAVIGRGAFGEVRLCKSKQGGQLVAIKRLKKQEMVLKNQVGHIKAERNLLAKSDGQNPWVVQLKCSFQDANSLYLVMQFLQGGDLMNLLIKRLVLTHEEARFYVAELVLAVESIHQMDYIHRDLKPDNILIDASGHIKLSDFGLCKHSDLKLPGDCPRPERVLSNLSEINRRERRTRRQLAYSHVGTPDYIAPQMLTSHGYNESVDWWSVGVILYEMLIGEAPFCSDSPGETYAKIEQWQKYLHFPEDVPISDPAKDLILGLVTSPSQRLSASEIKAHPFFSGIDWRKIRQVKPPFIPAIRSSTDVSNFDQYEADQEWGIQQKRRDPQFIGYTFKQNQEFNELENMKLLLKRYSHMRPPASQKQQLMKFNDLMQKGKNQPDKASFHSFFNAHSNLTALKEKQQRKSAKPQGYDIHHQRQMESRCSGRDSARIVEKQNNREIQNNSNFAMFGMKATEKQERAKNPSKQREFMNFKLLTREARQSCRDQPRETVRQYRKEKPTVFKQMKETRDPNKQPKVEKKELRLFKHQSRGLLCQPVEKQEGMFFNILKKQNAVPNMPQMNLLQKTLKEQKLGVLNTVCPNHKAGGKSPLLKAKQKPDEKTKSKIVSPNFKALLSSLPQDKKKK